MSGKNRILALIWLMMAVAYFDRVNLAIAGPTIMPALHLDKVQFGWALSAFQIGYALMQIPGGALADRQGARPLLIAALVLWSVFTALTGLVGSLAGLIVVRVLFGFGEGIENGAQFKLIGDHFDSRERSGASAVFLSALAIGPAIASPIVTGLIVKTGWRGVFFASAVLGLIVAALLAAFLPREQREQPERTARSRNADMAPRGDWGSLLSRSTSWLAFAAYLFFNVAFWSFVYWIPTYLSDTRHIALAKLGWVSSIPYVCGFLGSIGLGYLGSHGLRRWRAALVAVAYLFGALFLCLTFRAGSVSNCLTAISLAAFCLYGGFGPFWAVALDLTDENRRGAFAGFVNFGGQIGGILTPIIVGTIVKRTGSFTDGFLFMMAALVLSAGCLLALQWGAASPAPEMAA